MSQIANHTAHVAFTAQRPVKSLFARGSAQAGNVIFWLLTIAIAVGSWRFLLLGVEASMEVVRYHEILRPLVLYAHIVPAPLALLLVPFQLWQGLRKRRPAVHKVLGRIYGIAIMISGFAGLWLAITVNSGLVAATGFGFLAITWLGTTAMGIGMAMRHDYAAHRRWIIRSVAVTLSAVTLRLYIIPTEVFEIGGDWTYPAIAWLCWVPNVIVAEIYLYWPKLKKSFQSMRQLETMA